jgi:DNA-binding response OmpR family regulator
MILVVDDFVPAGRALVKLLHLEGESAHYLNDGSQVLEFVRSQAVRLVVLDWMMPGTDGLDVLTAIRAEHRYAKLPVVVYTSLDDEAHRLIAAKAGADDFVMKGGRFEELMLVLRKYL